MRWQLAESLFKGLYLGLLFYVALQAPSPASAAVAVAWPFAGLIAALAIAAGRTVRGGVHAAGKPAAFVLFLLLENPHFVYAGILLGSVAAAVWVRQPGSDLLLAGTVIGGAILGAIIGFLPRLTDRWVRFGLGLTLAAVVGGGMLAGLYYLQGPAAFNDSVTRTPVGAALLLGVPLFYLLGFAGISEETEVEIGVLGAALAVGCVLLSQPGRTSESMSVLVPLLLYVVYTTRFLPGLRVFKHTLRGISYANVGQRRRAILAFRRGLELDPNNRLAQESLWNVHRSMSLAELVDDPQMMSVLDLDLCLARASSLLLEPRPGQAKIAEANHLLDVVLHQRPAMRPRIDYWRAVADTHAGKIDDAVGRLESLLDPASTAPCDAQRADILFPAWQLALTLHSELKRRVGFPQLTLAGRRMEAIAAVERRLKASPEDGGAWELKRIVYSELTEAEYKAAAGGDQAAADFDHAYAEQLGLALLGDAARWQRGVEYLRLAARGQPDRATMLFVQMARAYQHSGQPEAAWDYYELAKRAGRAFGPKNLPEKERQEYFAVIKLLAEHARNTGNLDAAVENYQLYTEFDRSGLETLRTLAQIHEERGDVLSALRLTDQALVYNPKDKDLLDRKDRYYYSVMPEQLQARLDSFKSGFDVDYCLGKARSLLDYKNADLDLLDWAEHLARLASVVRPESLAAKVLRARALRRRGEIEAARALLQQVYEARAEKYPSAADEEAWYLSCRLLGEAYLFDVGRPDLAVACFQDFRKSAKSGADTLFKLGQAYEQLGDRARARRYYEHVASYEGHPLVSDAREAIYRLQATQAGEQKSGVDI